MGRYPANGYLQFTKHSANSEITGPDAANIPFDPVGAEVVIRKDRYVLDRHKVVSRVAQCLYYSSLDSYGNNRSLNPNDLNGFFVQASLSCLSKLGDWYFDQVSKRLYVCFPLLNPSVYHLSVCDEDVLMPFNETKNVVLSGIDFEGGNVAIALNASSDIKIKDCHFRNQGRDAIHALGSKRIAIEDCQVSGALNCGINFEFACQDISISKTKVVDIGMIPGAGVSGSNSSNGIMLAADRGKVSKCIVHRTGYNGISINGDSAEICENLIDSTCLIKDDGAGIYTYIGKNAIIANNVVRNSIGTYKGAEWGYWEPWGKAAGIYLDNGTMDHSAVVKGNIVNSGGWCGILINNNAGSAVTHNTVNNFPIGIYIISYTAGAVQNVMVTGNKIGKSGKQISIMQHNLDTLSNMGTFEPNTTLEDGRKIVPLIEHSKH